MAARIVGDSRREVNDLIERMVKKKVKQETVKWISGLPLRIQKDIREYYKYGDRRSKKESTLDKEKLLQALSRHGKHKQWHDAYDMAELRRKKAEEEARDKLNDDVNKMPQSTKDKIINAFKKRAK